MRAWSILLLLIERASSLLPYGQPDCPCVDPYPVVQPGVNTSSCASGLQDAAGVCYGAEYGSRGCRAYDTAFTDECLSSTPLAWCADRWCYVAPWNCLRPRFSSEFFPGAKLGNSTLLAEAGVTTQDGSGDPYSPSAQPLVYSYETCGNIDLFTSNRRVQDAMARIASRGGLRLTIVPDNPPFQYTAAPNETDFVAGTSRRDGAIPRFFTHVLAEYNVPWTEVATTSEALRATGSAWTGCIYDVALNSTDICLGSTWAFEERRRLAPFTATLTSARLHLVVRSTDIQDDASVFLSMIAQPFMPFTLPMWLAFLGVLAYVGYAMYTLDASGYESDDEDEDAEMELVEAVAVVRNYTRQRSSGVGATSSSGAAITTDEQLDRAKPHARKLKKRRKLASNWVHIFCPTTADDMRDLATSLANSLQAYLAGDYLFKPHSASSRVVLLGLAFLCLIITANYTAKVTLSGVITAMTSRVAIRSLEEGISQGYRFCGWGALQRPIEAAIPGMLGRYVVKGGYDTLLAMDAGECDAAIIEEHTWQILTDKAERHAKANYTHCRTKTLLPEVVWTADIAFAVREDLQRPLSMAIVNASEAGLWLEYDSAARATVLPQDACRDAVSSSSAASTERLDIEHGAGTLIVVCLLTTAALLTNCLWYATPAARVERARHREWLEQYRMSKPTPAKGKAETNVFTA